MTNYVRHRNMLYSFGTNLVKKEIMVQSFPSINKCKKESRALQLYEKSRIRVATSGKGHEIENMLLNMETRYGG